MKQVLNSKCSAAFKLFFRYYKVAAVAERDAEKWKAQLAISVTTGLHASVDQCNFYGPSSDVGIALGGRALDPDVLVDPRMAICGKRVKLRAGRFPHTRFAVLSMSATKTTQGSHLTKLTQAMILQAWCQSIPR